MSARSTLLVAHPKELIRAGIGQLLDDTAVSIVGEAADVANFSMFVADVCGGLGC
jgi:hypothetical protein